MPEILDIRALAPKDRHALIFKTYEELQPGQSFVLVNDHDPKPCTINLSLSKKGNSPGATWSRDPKYGA